MFLIKTLNKQHAKSWKKFTINPITFERVARQLESCITSRLYQKKGVKSCLAKQAMWQVHIPLPQERNNRHYDVAKPNKQQQFALSAPILALKETHAITY